MPGTVIIGAGHGGVQLAASLRETGYEGRVRLISADPDLPYHKPPLSKSFMKTPDAPLQPLRGEAFFDQNDIALDLGREVVRVERERKRLICSDGSALDYDKLVLATGTRARKLTVPGAELDGVHSLRTAEDARALRADLPGARRVVVIGGGFIGLEAAAMLAARGLSVSVVELAPRLLGRAVSSITAQTIASYLEGEGVSLHLDTAIEAIDGQNGRVTDVRLSDEVLAADLVLVGVGAEPMDELARDAGLVVENGIVVDEFLATSAPDIFAIGDCVSFPQVHLGCHTRLESVQNATDQARSLAQTLTGTPQPYAALPWFWSDIGAVKLQIAGLAREGGETLATRSDDGQVKSVYHLAGGQLVACETLNSAGEHMLSRRMIAEGITPARTVLETGDTAEIKKAYAAVKNF
ncbi:rubredoxin reductase [Roseobacter sp. MED193]|uniref:NAD(P)/FAD-dependent oxidoreductase n=1 Tax=Roseobacter sp. MED193 TaxID=314262 RepID=UPI000068E3EE|nr:FAD-dependent oxidoreductase [Roseobacter sp. MED193]EAQ43663.1 rubredoxin reductase [Roseobacter sp. MED193]